MTTGRQMFGLNPSFVKSDLNLFLLPHMDKKKHNQGKVIESYNRSADPINSQTLIVTDEI